MAHQLGVEAYLLVRVQARRCFERGDYPGVITICDHFIERTQVSPDHTTKRHIRSLLNEKGRALRNSGQLQAALQIYMSALKNARADHDDTDEAWQLVQLGKLFGKYLQRQTFFSACLREAEVRLKRKLDAAAQTSAPINEIARRFAIVQDLLGSHYRAISSQKYDRRDRCIAAYRSAIRFHRIAGNSDGVSRAVCHLASSLAAFAYSDATIPHAKRNRRLKSALVLFEYGAHHAYRHCVPPHARATRRAQEAAIYIMLGKARESLPLLAEAMRDARDVDDPRALILALRLLGQAEMHLGAVSDATTHFELARSTARDREFTALQRQVLRELIAAYLSLDEPGRALDTLEESDSLIEKELADFKSGSGGALDLFRSIAPENGDVYLREGQQQDYELLVNDVIQNDRMLRDLVAHYERAKSAKLQFAVHHFTKLTVQHSIKKELHDVAIAVKQVKHRLGALAATNDTGMFLKSIDESVSKIERVLGTQSVLPSKGPTSFEIQLRLVVQDFFDVRRFQVQLTEDAQFRDLAPELLRHALRHLVENAVAAVRAAEPEGAVPYLLVRDERPVSGDRIVLLMNPGTNPRPRDLEKDIAEGTHGWRNARWFFQEVLGCDCRFELRDDGPRSVGWRSNCVVIVFPFGKAPGVVWSPLAPGRV